MCYIHPQTPTEVMDREGKPILGLPSKDRSLIHSLSRYLTNKIFATPCARHLGYTALPPRRSIDWFYRNVSVWLALRMPRSHIANSKIFCFGFGEDQMRHENIWKLESSLHIWGVNIIYMTTLFRWLSDSSRALEHSWSNYLNGSNMGKVSLISENIFNRLTIAELSILYMF